MPKSDDNNNSLRNKLYFLYYISTNKNALR